LIDIVIVRSRARVVPAGLVSPWVPRQVGRQTQDGHRGDRLAVDIGAPRREQRRNRIGAAHDVITPADDPFVRMCRMRPTGRYVQVRDK